MKSETPKYGLARVQLEDGDMVQVTHIVDVYDSDGWLRFQTTKTIVSFNADAVQYYVVTEMDDEPPEPSPSLH